LYVTVSWPTVETLTAVVGTVNVAVVAPAGTTTGVGGVIVVMLDVTATLAPPVGAAEGKVTVAVNELPPLTEAGAVTPSVPVVPLLIVSVAVADPW
jgi:hypothetical protein